MFILEMRISKNHWTELNDKFNTREQAEEGLESIRKITRPKIKTEFRIKEIDQS